MAAAGERDITNKRLIEVIKAHEGQTINLEIKRGGNILTVPVTPRKITDTVMIGAQLSGFEMRTIEPGPFEALKMSLDQNWTWAKMIVQTLGGSSRGVGEAVDVRSRSPICPAWPRSRA
jgi:hypothetical protein